MKPDSNYLNLAAGLLDLSESVGIPDSAAKALARFVFHDWSESIIPISVLEATWWRWNHDFLDSAQAPWGPKILSALDALRPFANKLWSAAKERGITHLVPTLMDKVGEDGEWCLRPLCIQNYCNDEWRFVPGNEFWKAQSA